MSPRKTLARRPVERQEARGGPGERRRQQGGERVEAREEDARSRSRRPAGRPGRRSRRGSCRSSRTATIQRTVAAAASGPSWCSSSAGTGHALEPSHLEHDQAHHAELGHEAREGREAGPIVGQPDERQGDATQHDRDGARVVRPRRPRARSATSTATAIAVPPPRGTTVPCEERSFGRSSRPSLRASLANAGVSTRARARARTAARAAGYQGELIDGGQQTEA